MNHFSTALVGGACSGMAVDLMFFPLDTIKTRLQSPQGFLAAGGLRGMYRGVGSTLAASAPGAALFFATYDMVKRHGSQVQETWGVPAAAVHMTAATVAEAAACCVRVPAEVVKQRAQVGTRSTWATFQWTLRHQGGFRGLYRGYGATLLREVPFTAIQFGLYEALREARGTPAGVAGGVAGGAAAWITCPLDVVKTRVMLAGDASSAAVWNNVTELWASRGIRAFFAGAVPRTLWISAGGAVFLGVYDAVTTTLRNDTKPL
ncbi:hypothetical protein TBLA_0C01260 [Henningerozyma blattae CBS 6284]|uniref:Mitochondrial carrier protein PET8 n=1 Tax=Henningerozyma blattae (strain ATCC 34711 / CBS 6284 / DSM 70876 / NBRC 10599 / NRRL Y-10934 / UCD 77-7) TaxID=1071380 RepID=I2H0N9_HENB6|nr:hypothetical protein TBLA_0C01260 [Tetrapisispora blattae CBS 6284]CCH59941.1 hypothetical protein TBLA_0C01260 [Tetrapisispora blattae CBS 6284]